MAISEDINKPPAKLLYIINVDWYFMLHWLDRAKAAKDSGYDVHIAMQHTDLKYCQRLKGLGFHTYKLPISRKSINILTELRTLAAINRLLKELKPEIIHSVTIKPNIYAGLCSRIRGIPIIASITGLGTTFSSKKYELARIVKYFIQNAYRLAFAHPKTKVLFENIDDLNQIVCGGFITRDQAVLIPGAGVNTNLYSPTPPLPSPPINVLFAARLLRNKGLYQLVDVISAIRSDGIDICLTVAGIIDNDALGTIPINQLESWHKQGFITWLGQVEDMPKLINDSHIICLPTLYGEGIPRILIEGASCGRPIVATDTQGCREIISNNENGLLVCPHSKPELKNALSALATSPNVRKEMGIRGRKVVEEKYCSNIVIRKTLMLYTTMTPIK